FDSLGNLLAIVFGIADKEKSTQIISFIKEKKVDRPYPLRAIFPPIKKGSNDWKDYFDSSLAGQPNQYLNGGIWPFIGGFYVAALEELKMHEEAIRELELLVEANRIGQKEEWEFNEWINPVNGLPQGGFHQAWSAGSYLLAFECVKNKKNLLKI
ncbi:MAG: glycoside hydrolase 100 family protein, partial [Candidatus Diapherotrites archaeon]